MARKRLRDHLTSVAFAAVLTGAAGALAVAFVYFGVYNIGADAPHSAAVTAMLDDLRDRSIAVRARGIVPPADLGATPRIAKGAGLYAEMCAGCHLAPGLERTELAQGLYPQAPELAKVQDLSPPEQFWIIKHGVKMSAMPAWGRTHPDPLIWDMVAFVRTLPTLSADRYKALVASAPEDHDAMMKDMHDHH